MTFLKKIDLLMLKEFIPLFIVGILTFSVLMISFTLLREAMKFYSEYGLPLSTILIFFVYGLPQIFAYTFPMSILLASLLTFGRMSMFGEITALRAGGIDFFRILLPILVTSYFVTCATYVINELVAPKATLAAQNYVKAALTEIGISLSEKNIAFLDADGQWLFGAENSKGNEFYDVKLIDYRNPKTIVVYIAEDAIWDRNTWIFRNVNLYNLGGRGTPFYQSSFEELSIDLNRTPTELLKQGRDPEEMSLKELKNFITSVTKTGEMSSKAIKKLQSKYYLKITMPLSCILFPLIAAPLGMNPHRGSSTVGMGLSILLVFAYYVLVTIAINISQTGLMNPSVASWIPNAVFFLVGVYLNGVYYTRAGR